MLVGLLLFIVFILTPKSVIAGCQVTISNDGRFLINETVPIEVTITNTGDTNIGWIKIPINLGGLLTNINLTAGGWSANNDSESIIFTNWYISPGSGVIFEGNLTASALGEVDWTIQSSDTDESGAISCNSVHLNVLDTLVVPQPPAINNAVASVESSAATISWQTDVESTGQINYGLTSGYGTSLNGESGVKNHSVRMTGLTPSTTYHYQIVSANNNGTTTTVDNSITTSAAGVVAVITSAPIVVTTTTVVTNTVTNTTIITPTPTPKPLVDTVAPVVKVVTVFDKPYKASPLIEGRATDGGDVNVGVTKMDYSIDGGKNWTPMDVIDHPGSRQTTFAFTPTSLDDGNYKVRVRAADRTGNVGFSKLETLVIDRLPPKVGGGVYLVGPMLLTPDENGAVYVLSDSDVKMVWSAVGGPLNFEVMFNGNKATLLRSVDTGLWGGKIRIADPGKYELKTDLADGAKNETSDNLGSIIAVTKGKIVDDRGVVPGAIVSVYVYEKTGNNFVLWNGGPYDQLNPQASKGGGEYSLFLPGGKYYIEVVAKDKRRLRTSIFEIDKPTPIVADFEVSRGTLWNRWWADEVVLNVDEHKVDSTRSELIGQMVPEFDLSSQTHLSSATILGKPTIITLVTTWMPQTLDQLESLRKFKNNNQGVNVFAVFEQESESKISLLKKIEGYNFDVVADPDGILTELLSAHGVPTNVFLDRKGIIKYMKVGFLHSDSLIKMITD